MKKIISVNLAGIAFKIDEEAYSKLESYVSHLEKYFRHEPGYKEMMEDMEGRMAELLSARTKDGATPVTVRDVDHVIETIGDPSEFDPDTGPDPERKQDSQRSHQRSYSGNKHRKLFRDPDDRVIFGVCSGLAAYFQIDPVIMRIIFLVGFFFSLGASLLIYFIIAVAVPKAHTYEEKMRMRQE